MLRHVIEGLCHILHSNAFEVNAFEVFTDHPDLASQIKIAQDIDRVGRDAFGLWRSMSSRSALAVFFHRQKLMGKATTVPERVLGERLRCYR